MAVKRKRGYVFNTRRVKHRSRPSAPRARFARVARVVRVAKKFNKKRVSTKMRAQNKREVKGWTAQKILDHNTQTTVCLPIISNAFPIPNSDHMNGLMGGGHATLDDVDAFKLARKAIHTFDLKPDQMADYNNWKNMFQRVRPLGYKYKFTFLWNKADAQIVDVPSLNPDSQTGTIQRPPIMYIYKWKGVEDRIGTYFQDTPLVDQSEKEWMERGCKGIIIGKKRHVEVKCSASGHLRTWAHAEGTLTTPQSCMTIPAPWCSSRTQNAKVDGDQISDRLSIAFFNLPITNWTPAVAPSTSPSRSFGRVMVTGEQTSEFREYHFTA